MSSGGFHIVIPARMASERLPGKPLAMLAGRPLIEHVFQRACAAGADTVSIATDSNEVKSAARSFGANVVMTSADHQSGTDRIAECVSTLGLDQGQVVVNLQGDEPLMPAACLVQVAALLHEDHDADMASLYWPIEDEEDISNPNVVKVVVNAGGAAMYFSRSPIPFPRHARPVPRQQPDTSSWKRHIGLYAYRVAALQEFSQLPPSELETVEKLEQLRMLESGGKIAMARACEFIPAGVDTPEDLERVRTLLRSTVY